MGNIYDVEWAVDDWGLYVSKVMLHMPEAVDIAAMDKDTFNVFVARKDKEGKTFHYTSFFFGMKDMLSTGYRTVLAAYPADTDWNPMHSSDLVVLELSAADSEARPIAGGLNGGAMTDCEYRITQVKPIGMLCGAYFDEQGVTVSPQCDSYQHGVYEGTAGKLNYAYYDPKMDSARPMIIWLHGAGEGGPDIRLAYMGNNVPALSSEKVQSYFGGAFVFVPQCMTMWMDDGSHTYGHSGLSMYSDDLWNLLNDFASSHNVDRNHIYIGGCSNGGFMSMRMVVDHPDFFAGAYPMCECLYDDVISDEQLEAIKNVPIWFLHAMCDTIVPPLECSVPTYKRLIAAGAPNVHMTFVNDNPPFPSVGHGVWVKGLDDQDNYDFDMQPVLVDGKPVTRFQWLAAQHK